MKNASKQAKKPYFLWILGKKLGIFSYFCCCSSNAIASTTLTILLHFSSDFYGKTGLFCEKTSFCRFFVVMTYALELRRVVCARVLDFSQKSACACSFLRFFRKNHVSLRISCTFSRFSTKYTCFYQVLTQKSRKITYYCKWNLIFFKFLILFTNFFSIFDVAYKNNPFGI